MRIVSTGIYYALTLAAAGFAVNWVAGPWFALPLWLLALFCLYFFRDPERDVPSGPVAVSPADGRVIEIKPEGLGITRLTIFLNVFDVHVNRTPIPGKVTCVTYKKGEFLVASKEEASAENEQNKRKIRITDGFQHLLTRGRVVSEEHRLRERESALASVKPGDLFAVQLSDQVGLVLRDHFDQLAFESLAFRERLRFAYGLLGESGVPPAAHRD